MRFYPEYVFARAEEYFDAQRRLRAREQEFCFYWPRYLLFCQAIELALKAFLAAAEAIDDDDAAFRRRHGIHDLGELLNKANSAGLSISTATQKSIRSLSEVHEKHWARYVQENDPIPALDQFEANIVELLTVVCRRVGRGNFRPFVQY